MNTVTNGTSHTPVQPQPVICVADVASTFESFTKKEAQALFDNRLQNRNIRTVKVNEYRDLMNSGKWVNRCRSQTPILIDRDGKLAGGQHRMLAFIKSDLTTIELPVARNISKDELPYQDANIARSVRDRVNMFEKLPVLHNITNTTLIASLKIVLDYKNATGTNKMNPADPETIAKVGKEVEAVLVSIDSLLNKRSFVIKYASMVAAFIVAHPLMDESKWEFCLEKTSNFENLQSNDPMYRFRDFTTSLPRGFSNADRWDVFLKSLFCLRAEQKDEKVNRVLAQQSVLDDQTWK